MILMKKFIQLLFLGLLFLILFLSVKHNENNLIWEFDGFFRFSTAVCANFSCQTWKNISYINQSKYEACLSVGADDSFWLFEGIRHTAHKHLLNSSSLIIEVGGNRAHDTVKFVEFHNPWIISFEPLVFMAKNLTDQFKDNPKVQVRPYGLGNHARRLLVEPNDAGNAGTSIFRPLTSPNSSSIEHIELLDIVKVIQDIRKTRTRDGMIDMISINCEGCEFEVIPALILNNLTQYFRIIQFASHINLVPEASCIYCQIKQSFERTHQSLFYFSKLWEGWVLNK